MPSLDTNIHGELATPADMVTASPAFKVLGIGDAKLAPLGRLALAVV